MAKEKISFKNGSRFCYSVKENNLNDFYDKIIELSTMSDEDYLIDLRLDYLINKKIDIQDIIKCIVKAKKVLTKDFEVDRQFIATIRNFSNGGNCLISDKNYLEIVETLYEKPSVDAIDIDYDFYESKSTQIKKMFSGMLSRKKTLIITYTCRDKILSKEDYDNLFKTLIKTPAYIVKIVTKAFSTEDTEKLMNAAREYDNLLKKNNKVAVVISTGKLGILSRVWYEYSNTMIVYLDAYDLDMVPQGEINKKVFDKCRKLISNLDEFSDLSNGIQDVL